MTGPGRGRGARAEPGAAGRGRPGCTGRLTGAARSPKVWPMERNAEQAGPRRSGHTVALLCGLLCGLLASAPAGAAGHEPAGDATSEPWRVESLGNDVYLFRWLPGFYVSVFVVGDEGVLAFDPISRAVAAHYRRAVARVTDRPVTHVLYSHDHRDHIVGADVLADEPVIYAHPRTAAQIERRGDTDIPPPTELLRHGDTLDFDRHRLSFHDFAPNHSDSNLLVTLATGRGRLLVWVDGVEPGIAPYRNLPDTDLRGLIATLSAADGLGADLVLGGHAGPADAVWIGRYREYFDRLLASTRAAYDRHWGRPPLPGEDGVAATERVTAAVVRDAAAPLIAAYPDWAGIEEWAPLNASRALSYLITGN